MSGRVLVLGVLACVACGRIGFDPSAASSDAPQARSSDAPPLAAQVCEVHQIAIPPGMVPTHADLAVTATAGAVTAVWADADALAGQTPWGTRVETTTFSAVVPPMQLAGVTAREIAGVRDLGATVMLEPVISGQLAIGQLSESLSNPTTSQPAANGVAGRDPFARSNTLGTFVTMYAQGSLHWAAMSTAGTIGPYGTYTPSTGSIGAFACDDGPDHVHVGFRIDPTSGSSSCIMGSVYFSDPSTLYLGANFNLPGNCTDVRVAASADSSDSLFGFWQVKSGELDAAFVDSMGTFTMIPVTTAGRAPRTKYDGSKYRLAWIDSTSGDELHLGVYPPNGSLVKSALPGWTSAGDNAFSLLRQGNLVWLVILSASELSLLRLC